MSHNILQDMLTFTLTAEETLTNETVRITVQINGVTGDDDEALNKEVRTRLRQLIDSESWNLSGMVRQRDATGLERFSISATVRVPESENARLFERCEAVSRPGFKVTVIEQDTSIPTQAIQECKRRLRKRILEDAEEEVKLLTTDGRSAYRVHQIEFDHGHGFSASNATRAFHNKGMMPTMAMEAAGASDDGGQALGHSEKHSLSGTVTLAKIVLGNDSQRY
jgi:hypothetical protein